MGYHLKQKQNRYPFLLFLVGLCFLLNNCADITLNGLAPLHKTINVSKKAYPLQGRVYTMRGLLGIFSLGMDQLAQKTEKELKVRSMSVALPEAWKLKNFIVTQHKSRKLTEPIVLVGHSLGADSQIKVAEHLNRANIPVDLLVTVEAVNPRKIPSNVKIVYNIYKSRPLDFLPMVRGVPVKAADSTKTFIDNVNLTNYSESLFFFLGHVSIDKSADVQKMIIKKIRTVLTQKQNDRNKLSHLNNRSYPNWQHNKEFSPN